MKKLCRVVGFTALAWAILMPSSYAYHDVASGRFDSHGLPGGSDPLPEHWSRWSKPLQKQFGIFKTWRNLSLGGPASRAIRIVISNGLKDRRLVNPKVYLYVTTGEVAVPKRIHPGRSAGVFFTRPLLKLPYNVGDFPTLRGTVGVLSYQIEGLDARLAILWSVPYNRVLSKNWFNIKIMKNNGPGTSVDHKLYKSMYYREKPKRGSKLGGYHRFDQRGFGIVGAMGDGKHPILDVKIY